MKKIMLSAALLFAAISYAQDGFPFIPSETVAEGSPVTLNLNDVGDSAGLIPDVYTTLRLVTDWVSVSGNPQPEEASIEVITTAGSVTLSPATIITEPNPGISRLKFLVALPGNYLPQNDGYLDVILRQTGTGTTADWNSIFIEVLPCDPPIASVSVAEDCANDQFYVDVNISDIGSFGQCEIYDVDFEYYVFVTTPGMYTVGPYSTDFGREITVAGHTSSGCVLLYENVGIDCDNLSVDSFDKTEISYYPNPVTEFLTLSTDQAIQEIKLYNLTGQIVYRQKLNSSNYKLDMSSFNSGVYFIEVRSNSGKNTLKILKE
ncbi:T9SS type A sorting domain-containing protein [Winogradskyella sp. 3972H.M.0a.05]|uniref:T9SS type A sorting domain-containing protein n=1 Tax=Winogradskyella sp. 3972H.M.0a.05 TaxID=2950277 RepID=UPI00339AB1F1